MRSSTPTCLFDNEALKLGYDRLWEYDIHFLQWDPSRSIFIEDVEPVSEKTQEWRKGQKWKGNGSYSRIIRPTVIRKVKSHAHPLFVVFNAVEKLYGRFKNKVAVQAQAWLKAHPQLAMFLGPLANSMLLTLQVAQPPPTSGTTPVLRPQSDSSHTVAQGLNFGRPGNPAIPEAPDGASRFKRKDRDHGFPQERPAASMFGSAYKVPRLGSAANPGPSGQNSGKGREKAIDTEDMVIPGHASTTGASDPQRVSCPIFEGDVVHPNSSLMAPQLDSESYSSSGSEPSTPSGHATDSYTKDPYHSHGHKSQGKSKDPHPACPRCGYVRSQGSPPRAPPPRYFEDSQNTAHVSSAISPTTGMTQDAPSFPIYRSMAARNRRPMRPPEEDDSLPLSSPEPDVIRDAEGFYCSTTDVVSPTSQFLLPGPPAGAAAPPERPASTYFASTSVFAPLGQSSQPGPSGPPKPKKSMRGRPAGR